jgi:TonB family protein
VKLSIRILLTVLFAVFAAVARTGGGAWREIAAQNQSVPIPGPTLTTQIFRPDSGRVADNIYTNDFFGFTYEFPKGWIVPDDGVKKLLVSGRGSDTQSADPSMKLTVVVPAEHSLPLLLVLEHPPRKSVSYNKFILVSADDLSFAHEVQSCEDYLTDLKSSLQKTLPDLKTSQGPTDYVYAGNTFKRMEYAYATPSAATVYQSVLCIIRRSQVLAFAFTSDRPDSQEHLIETLNTLQFKPGPLDAYPQQLPGAGQQIAILTPTGNVNFNPFILKFSNQVKQKWIAAMPDVARQGARGRVVLVMEINKAGALSDGPLVESSSGTTSLDEAAVGAVRAASPFDHLPVKFEGPFIQIRMVFRYNLPFKSGSK